MKIKEIAMLSIIGVVVVALFLSSTVQNVEAKGGGNSGDYIRFLCATKNPNLSSCKDQGFRSPEKPLKGNGNNNNNNNQNNNNQNNNNQNNNGCILSKYIKTCTDQVSTYYPGGKGHPGQIVSTPLTLKQTSTDKTPTFIFFTEYLKRGHTEVSCSPIQNTCFVSYR